jgi:hypothetical protein
MNKYIIEIDGMRCGMCESHVNDLFRRHLKLIKVKSNHKTGQTVLISDVDFTDSDLKMPLDNSGYVIKRIIKEEAKKTLFGYH